MGNSMTLKDKASFHHPTQRVLDVMSFLAVHPEGSTLTEISDRTEIPKSTLVPILYTLLGQRFISINRSTMRYVVGIKALIVGSACTESEPLLVLIKEELKEIVTKCSETCQLGILEGGDVFYVVKIDSPEPIRMISSVGACVPAYATALGKALVSDYSEVELKKLFPKPFSLITANTKKDISELYCEVKKQAQNGIFMEREESTKGIICYALPLKKNEKIVAAISVTAPIFRLDKTKEKQIKTALIVAQKKIEKLINKYSSTDNFFI